MFRSIFLISLSTVLMVASTVASQTYVVSVAGKNYTAQDLQNIMSSNNLELPDQAIQKLQRDAALKLLSKSESEIYQSSFGEQQDLDKARSNARDIPTLHKKAAARGFIFESWLASKQQNIPVKYTNIEKYWDMVKQTKSYQVRQEAGMTLSLESIPFTIAELALPAEQVLSTRDNKNYLAGKEFNQYLQSNYNLVRDFVKRGKTIAQAQNYLIEKITSEKLATELMTESIKMDDIEAERQVAGFIRNHLYDDQLDLKGNDALSPSETMDLLYGKFEKRHSARIGKLKSALTGKGNCDQSDPELYYCLMNTKNDLVKKEIAKNINYKTTREWMDSNNFPGSYNEAQFVLMNTKYTEHLSNIVKENGVVFNYIK